MGNNKKYIFIFLGFFLMMFVFQTDVLAAGLDCRSWGEVRKDFQNIFDFCKIVIPLLIIGLSAFDYVKAIAGKDIKDLKKSTIRLLKRLCLAILFFFLPVILNYFLDFIGTGTTVCID